MARWLSNFLILLIIAPASAQDDACPMLQDEALANILARCADQESGTLCLGHPTVTLVPRPGIETAEPFSRPGDTVAIESMDWLSVSAEAKTWGVARAVFPAYPGDGLGTRQTALLAIGNVALFFPEPPPPPATFVDVEVSAAQGAYLRELPSTEARAIAPLAVSSELRAIARSEDRQWLFSYVAPEMRGWISAQVVTSPAAELPEMAIGSASAPLWLPWQIFDFRSGIDDAPCAGAPDSGILLQAPKSGSPTHFMINDVRLMLSGTAWLQAQISGGMRLHALDGAARVSVRDSAVNLSGGRYTALPLALDEDGAMMPAGPPAEPAAYDYNSLAGLPLDLLLYEARVGLDVYTIASPIPEGGGSPLASLSPEDDCRISAGQAGANIRSRPDPEAPVIAVMAYRESAQPVARRLGTDQLPWWKLGEGIWIRVDATVSGGNCNNIPLILPAD